MGFFSKVFDSLSGKNKRRAARRDISQSTDQAVGGIKPGFQRARDYTRQAGADAKNELQPGYTRARGQVSQGSQAAQSTTRAGFGKAKQRAETGLASAQGRYETPEMTTSRSELLSRVMGKGGYSPETLNAMKAGAREEFGTGLRSAEQALNSYYGESGAGGMAGENLALAASELGGQRGRAVRDIDIDNAMLQEKQQTGAIDTLQSEAGQRAGIDERSTELLSGLERGEASALAGLQTQEAFRLAGLSVDEAQGLASIAANVGLDLAGLSTEEATILANIYLGKGTNLAGTRDTTNWLGTVAVAGAEGAKNAAASAGSGGG